jgi:hypothetical protein
VGLGPPGALLDCASSAAQYGLTLSDDPAAVSKADWSASLRPARQLCVLAATFWHSVVIWAALLWAVPRGVVAVGEPEALGVPDGLETAVPCDDGAGMPTSPK